jgi:hypothetical protein
VVNVTDADIRLASMASWMRSADAAPTIMSTRSPSAGQFVAEEEQRGDPVAAADEQADTLRCGQRERVPSGPTTSRTSCGSTCVSHSVPGPWASKTTSTVPARPPGADPRDRERPAQQGVRASTATSTNCPGFARSAISGADNDSDQYAPDRGGAAPRRSPDPRWSGLTLVRPVTPGPPPARVTCAWYSCSDLTSRPAGDQRLDPLDRGEDAGQRRDARHAVVTAAWRIS